MKHQTGASALLLNRRLLCLRELGRNRSKRRRPAMASELEGFEHRDNRDAEGFRVFDGSHQRSGVGRPEIARALRHEGDEKTRILRLLIIAGVLIVVLLVLAFRRWDDGPIPDAEYALKVVPTYPRAAILAGLHGTAIVAITVGWDGRLLASSIRTSAGSTLLDDAALKAARESVYRPAMIGGVALQRSYIVFYTFSLDQ